MPQSEALPDGLDTVERDRIVANHRISTLASQISAISVELSKLELAVATNGDVSTARQKLAAVVAAAV